MPTAPAKQRISWYRTPVNAGALASLNKLSDWQGFIQSVGYLAVLVLSGGMGVACHRTGCQSCWCCYFSSCMAHFMPSW